jgi:hypothetical protein
VCFSRTGTRITPVAFLSPIHKQALKPRARTIAWACAARQTKIFLKPTNNERTARSAHHLLHACFTYRFPIHVRPAHVLGLAHATVQRAGNAAGCRCIRRVVRISNAPALNWFHVIMQRHAP